MPPERMVECREGGSPFRREGPMQAKDLDCGLNTGNEKVKPVRGSERTHYRGRETEENLVTDILKQDPVEIFEHEKENQ